MRLNLGCGEFYADGWVNVDLAADGQRAPDVIASMLDLPFGDGTVSAVYCGHVLEHLPLADVVPALAEVRRVLASGALLMVVGPDCRRAEALWRQGRIDRATLDGAVLGAGRWAGDEHLWRCDEPTLLRLLGDAGFHDARPVDQTVVRRPLWPIVAHVGWQCAVRASA